MLIKNLIREELFKAAEQQIDMPCSEILPKLSMIVFLYDNVGYHILQDSVRYFKCKHSTKRFFTEYAKFKVCARYYHHYIFFKDLFTIATDIEGGYITSVGNTRPSPGFRQVSYEFD